MRFSYYFVFAYIVSALYGQPAFADQGRFWSIVHEIVGDSPSAVLGKKLHYHQLQSHSPKAYVNFADNNAEIYLTFGLVNMLSAEELKFVIAHELSHIARDRASAITGSSKIEEECLADRQALEWIGDDKNQASISSLKKIGQYWARRNVNYPSLEVRIKRLESYFSSLSRN